MSSLSFQTAARERSKDEGARTPFDIDGEEFTAVRPKDEAFLLIVQASASQASLGDQVHAVFQFLDLALDPASGQRLRQRLLDPTDDCTVETLSAVMKALVEHWTGKAGGRPAVSAPSSKRTSKKSTAPSRSKASTS